MTGSERNKKLRDKRRSMGLCIECGEPSYSTYVRCSNHLYIDNVRQRKYYNSHKEERVAKSRANQEYRRNNNMCTACGTELIEEDGNHAKCMNCRSEIYFMRE